MSKGTNATFKGGKLEDSDHVWLDEEKMIKDPEQEKVYKYLGVDASCGIQHATMQEKLKKELVRRTRLILKSELNFKNSITEINLLAIPVITYSFNIIDRNLSKVRTLDIKIRKMMTTHSMHQPKADIHRLYLQRGNGGRGLTQLELAYKTSTIGLFRYLNLLDDWMLQLALKNEQEKGSHSVVKVAREFAREIDLDLENELDVETKNKENAQKLKRTAKEKNKKASDIAWKSKPLHGQYPLRSQKAEVDLHDTHQWLRSARLEAQGVDSVIQALRLLTTSSQGALFLPQMSIQTDIIVLDNIYIEKSVTIIILKYPINGISINCYLFWIPKR